MSTEAILYRMATSTHICPFGLKSKHLLKQQGYEVEDILLKTRKETDEFKKSHEVETTPQAFIGGKRIGGYDDLRTLFNKKPLNQSDKTYKPIIAIFVITFLMAVSVNYLLTNTLYSVTVLELFIAISMCFLAILKLQDLNAFSNQFLAYDLLSQKYVPYAYFYPFAEAGIGIAMIGKYLIWIAAPVAIVIGAVGAFSVFKAVYVDKRELKCACVGGNSNVPLGFVSMTENVMMMLMGIWMLISFPF